MTADQLRVTTKGFEMESFEITLAWLKAKAACHDQIAMFEQRFGKSVTVTADTAAALAVDFNIEFIAPKALVGAVLVNYKVESSQLWVDYSAKVKALIADYDAQIAVLLAKSILAQGGVA